MKKMIALIMSSLMLFPALAVAQEDVSVIEAGTVYVMVAVYSGTEWVPVADGVVPPTYISCQP